MLQHHLPAKSNRLVSQDTGVIGSQCFPVFAMLLSMVSSFRMAGGESQFLRLPGRQKPLVELSNDWVSACRHQSSHVQHSAHSGPVHPR